LHFLEVLPAMLLVFLQLKKVPKKIAVECQAVSRILLLLCYTHYNSII
jgi:hypothetical protein